MAALPAGSDVAFGEILRLAGNTTGQGEMLLTEAIVYGRPLNERERRELSQSLQDKAGALAADLQMLHEADPTTLSEAQRALVTKLRTIAPLQYAGSDSPEELGWAHGVSPGGGVVYYIDNVHGADSNDGLSLLNQSGGRGPRASLLEGYRRVKDGDALFLIATGKTYECPTELVSEEGAGIYHISNGAYEVNLGGTNRTTVEIRKNRAEQNRIKTRTKEIPARFE